MTKFFHVCLAGGLLLSGCLPSPSTKTSTQLRDEAGKPASKEPEIWAIVRSSDPPDYLGRVACEESVDGVVLYVGLSRLVPEEGKYDWSLFDKAFAECRKFGKPLKIAIIAGRWIPDWIYQKGAKKFEWTISEQYVDSGVSKASAPVPWDPVYLEAMKVAAQALAFRYGDDPVLKEVQVTGPALANGLEMNFNVTRGQAQEMGYEPGKLIAAWTQMVDAFASAFPSQKLSIALSNSVMGERTDMIARAVRDDAINTYGERVSLLVCYATDESWFNRGNQAVEIWLDSPVPVRREAQLIELYSDKNIDPTRAGDAIKRASSLGAASIEVFAKDILDERYRQAMAQALGAVPAGK